MVSIENLTLVHTKPLGGEFFAFKVKPIAVYKSTSGGFPKRVSDSATYTHLLISFCIIKKFPSLWFKVYKWIGKLGNSPVMFKLVIIVILRSHRGLWSNNSIRFTVVITTNITITIIIICLLIFSLLLFRSLFTERFRASVKANAHWCTLTHVQANTYGDHKYHLFQTE